VESLFPQPTATKIYNIAISPRSQVDRLIWAGTKNGAFSVKSAYNMDIERRMRFKGGCSTNPDLHPLWKVIWKLQVPQAIQLFIWHGCNDILPTREKLYQRKVVPDPFFQQCAIDVETSGHVLWQCKTASAVWACGPRVVQKCVVSAGDFLDIFQYLSR
jgi:hypothetical protein